VRKKSLGFSKGTSSGQSGRREWSGPTTEQQGRRGALLHREGGTIKWRLIAAVKKGTSGGDAARGVKRCADTGKPRRSAGKRQGFARKRRPGWLARKRARVFRKSVPGPLDRGSPCQKKDLTSGKKKLGSYSQFGFCGLRMKRRSAAFEKGKWVGESLCLDPENRLEVAPQGEPGRRQSETTFHARGAPRTRCIISQGAALSAAEAGID